MHPPTPAPVCLPGCSFNSTQPRLVHVPITTAVSALIGREVSRCYEHFQPDLVVSVHPLMQVG